MFKFTQSLCLELASLQFSQVPRHILLLFLMFPRCQVADLLCVFLGQLDFATHNYVPPKKKFLHQES